MTKSERERFQQIVQGSDWTEIGELVALCDRHDFWSDEFRESAATNAKKAAVRKLIKQLKDDDNFPLFASVETTNAEGRTVRVYKQESLFDTDDYRKVVKYHSQRSSYHRKMAGGYARRCRRRFRKQLAFGYKDGR